MLTNAMTHKLVAQSEVLGAPQNPLPSGLTCALDNLFFLNIVRMSPFTLNFRIDAAFLGSSASVRLISSGTCSIPVLPPFLPIYSEFSRVHPH